MSFRVGIISGAAVASEQRSVDVGVTVVADVLTQEVVGLQTGEVAVSIVLAVAEGVAGRLPAALPTAVLQAGCSQSVLSGDIGELLVGPHHLRTV